LNPPQKRTPERAGAQPARHRDIDAERAGQRLDNYLLGELKGVPRSHVYRLIRSGQVRALGVTSLQRIRALPDLPTIDESGIKGFQHASWTALAAPAGTPKEVVTRLNSEMNQILKLPDIQEKAAAGGAEIVGGTPEQAGMYLKSELAKFARLVKEANIRLE
jgi:tripartite-type tricarboxylate transporter receptor subunit TctC